MTWSELKEESKKMGDTCNAEDIIHLYKQELDITVFKYGTFSIIDRYGNDVCIVNRTPDQMWQIMKALQ